MRLLEYTKQLSNYYELWPQNIPTMSPASPSNPEINLFGKANISSHLAKLPAAPFLVPTVIESLLQSGRYRSLVQVVPGEADQFCADYVRINGGTVMTSDSDLMVYDLGVEGAVVFFKDLKIVETKTTKSLKCVQYKPATIIKRLSLPKPYGLLSLAFEMMMDPYGSFGQLLRKATNLKSISTYGVKYQEFSNLYNPLTLDMRLFLEANLSNMDSHLHLRRYLWTLDPRVSEFILQFPTFSQILGLIDIHQSGESAINMFLPFLLDYPLRTSAWEMSVSVRQLAYGLPNLIIPESEKIVMVVEHRRRERGSRGRECQVLNDKDMSEACISLLHMFEEIHSYMPNLSKRDFWRTVGVYQNFVQASYRSNPALSKLLMQVPKKLPFRLTWDGIQLFSQLEGSFYSFRILKQILELVLLHSGPGKVPAVFYELQNKLGTLPCLNELPGVVESLSRFGNHEDLAILEGVRKLLNLEANETMGVTFKEDKGKRKSGPSKVSGSSTKKPNNMFELLMSECSA